MYKLRLTLQSIRVRLRGGVFRGQKAFCFNPSGMLVSYCLRLKAIINNSIYSAIFGRTSRKGHLIFLSLKELNCCSLPVFFFCIPHQSEENLGGSSMRMGNSRCSHGYSIWLFQFSRWPVQGRRRDWVAKLLSVSPFVCLLYFIVHSVVTTSCHKAERNRVRPRRTQYRKSSGVTGRTPEFGETGG